MELTPLTPAIGARVTGIDLSGELGQADLDGIHRALVDHLLLVFPGQHLEAAHQLAFAAGFGDIDRPHEIYPHVDGLPEVTLLENDGERPPDTNDWHTDLTFHAQPPFASVLHAVVVPPSGGDTLWASQHAAYDALSDALKREIQDLSAVHDPGSFRNQFLGAKRDVNALNRRLAELGSAVHPVVDVHPVTGRPFLYVNPSFTRHIVGWSTSESDRLLHLLYNHMNRPEFQVRHRWSAGDVAMWDNRVTQHYACADYVPHYRRMHRVTVVNDRRSES